MSTNKLRYFEYYNMQETFDWLYQRSAENRTTGLNLYDIIQSRENILLAYRMIKSNTGSTTKGTDNLTINDYKIMSEEDFVQDIQESLRQYKPSSIKRVEIPKPNGKVRPLGIPTMKDRLIQQMIKQVIEPICEAKFYTHSYGFRPLRATSHAIARCNYLMFKVKCHHVVDVDIKSFFDHVNHSKLLHQLYTIGVRDKRVLAIISKMLKAPIKGIGIPKCGTPQGGILSPLLSNVVLNDLDWWISNQWETFPTRNTYVHTYNKYRAQKTTKLKEMHIVRYADDFKIFTANHKHAWKIFHAVQGYLKDYLKLDISKEKSKVTNLRRNYTEFLGFHLKVVKKNKQYVSISKISDKGKQTIINKYKEHIRVLQKEPTVSNLNRLNSFILGVQNYYKIATRVFIDLSELYYRSLKHNYNRLKRVAKYEIPRSPPLIYRKFYKQKLKTFKIDEVYLFPLADVRWTKPYLFHGNTTLFTLEGRNKFHKNLKVTIQDQIILLSKSAPEYHSLEYRDNRLSRYSMQNGKCHVTGEFLFHKEVHCHHILPISMGGTDKYDNLVIVHKWVHELIHATDSKTIVKYKSLLNLSEKQLKKLNKLRTTCNLTELT